MADPLTLATSIVLGIVTGLLYGGLWFAYKHQKNDEPLNHAKLGGTLILSGVIGGALALNGEPVTQATIVETMTANLAALTLLEAILKSVFREAGLFTNYAG